MKQIYKTITISLVLIISGIAGVYAQRLSDNEADYYVNKISNNTQVIDNLSGLDDGNDSELISAAIRNLSEQGGGYLQINKPQNAPYIYVRGVQVLSNVHIKVNSEVTFRPWYGGNAPRNIIMFQFGGNTNVENVAFTNMDEDNTDSQSFFKVEFTGDKDSRVKFMDVLSAYNFKVSGIAFSDCYSVYSNIECNLRKDQSRVEGDIPAQGLIKDVVSYKNHVGYGVVQIRAGKRILFKNLDGEGGITLRIESGFTRALESKEATIDQVVGRNIVVRKGDAALCLSPHRAGQGVIDVSGIKAIHSTNAVQVAAGFYDKKGGVDNLGTFNSNSIVDAITEVSGGKGAQVKTKDFTLYSCDLQNELYANKYDNLDGESTNGYSLAVVRNNADANNGCDGNKQGCYTIQLELPDAADVSGTHLGSKMVVYPDVDGIKCNTSSAKQIKKAKGPSVYPNPNKGVLNVKFNGLTGVNMLKVYAVDGSLQTKVKVKPDQQQLKISTQGWKKGNYILAFDNKKKLKVSVK